MKRIATLTDIFAYAKQVVAAIRQLTRPIREDYTMMKKLLILSIVGLLAIAGICGCSSSGDDDDTGTPMDDDSGSDDDSGLDDDAAADDDAADDDAADDDGADDDTGVDDDTTIDDDTSDDDSGGSGFDYPEWTPCDQTLCTLGEYTSLLGGNYVIVGFSDPISIGVKVDEALQMQIAEADVPGTLPGDITLTLEGTVTTLALFFKGYKLKLTGFEYDEAYIADSGSIHIETIGHASGSTATLSLVTAHFEQCEIVGNQVKPIAGGKTGTIDLADFTDIPIISIGD